MVIESQMMARIHGNNRRIAFVGIAIPIFAEDVR
jgi:hypothetical protein